MAKTSSLQTLIRSLGVSMVVVEPCLSHAIVFAEPPEDQLTASCLQDGLADAYNSDFDE